MIFRGLHFQTLHPQSKLVRAFAEAIFTYKCTDFYHPEDEGGLMWNDPAIGIDWKSVAPDVNPLLSEKDGKHPAFSPAKNYFDINGQWVE